MTETNRRQAVKIRYLIGFTIEDKKCGEDFVVDENVFEDEVRQIVEQKYPKAKNVTCIRHNGGMSDRCRHCGNKHHSKDCPTKH